MLEELDRFSREPVTKVELEQAINYLAGQTEVGRQSASGLAGEILDAWVSGNGLEDLIDPAAAFRGVGQDDILRVAARCLQPSHLAEGVIRGIALSSPVGG